jgi:hypothetical protein
LTQVLCHLVMCQMGESMKTLHLTHTSHRDWRKNGKDEKQASQEH